MMFSYGIRAAVLTCKCWTFRKEQTTHKFEIS